MNSFLMTAIIVQWLCLVGLGLVVFALVRQVGVLSERVAPAGALMLASSLRAGDRAPELVVDDHITSSSIRIGATNSDGRSTLLFFVSPDCPVCKTLLGAFKSASKDESDWLDTILATDGSRVAIDAFIEAENLARYHFVNSRELGEAYRVSKLPYAVLLDADGTVVTAGLVNSREHFDSLFNAQNEKVASIQEYLQREATRVNS